MNHHWLKNTFIPLLAKWERVLGGQVRDPRFDTFPPEGVLAAWPTHQAELEVLADEYAQALSPANLFLRRPLSSCDDQTRAWLSPLVHQLWLLRHEVHARVARVNAAIADVTDAFAAIEALSADEVSCDQPNRDVLAALVSALRRKCSALGKAINLLASEVHVT